MRTSTKSFASLFFAAVTFAISTALLTAQTNSATDGAAPGGRGARGGGFGAFGGRGGPPPAWVEAGYDDHQNMMNQLGIKALRPGKSGNNQNGPGFDEATANDWMSSMPDALTTKD